MPWPDGAGVVRLPDGRSVRARGLRNPPPPDAALAEFGVYFIGKDPGPLPWPYRWVRCRDFWIPSSTEDAVDALQQAHERAATERVEVGCAGGVGRTGTALAVLAALAGVPPADAVRWVREHDHHRAPETPWQRRWARRTAAAVTAERDRER